MMEDEIRKLVDKWRSEEVQFRKAASNCFETGHDDMGTAFDWKAITLSQCSLQLEDLLSISKDEE